MPIAPGTKLGQYEVQDFIGQGTMGLVYRAYHTQLERTGAVKVLQGIAPDADTTTRFRHEAQAIAQLRHPNILNVYDFGDFNGTPYMIVEYVPGGSLANRLSQGHLDQATALRYLRGIAAGLDYAHAHGVVHRDVKPANVLLEQDDTPVLADFGLAKLLQGSSLKSMSGVTTGTPAYMAPEQVTGSQVGPAADRYSLATIAYEMLTGMIPFDGEALLELLYAQVHRDPPVPSSRNSSLPDRVDAVIMRGLAKDPQARWPNCTAFVEALAAALSAAPATAVERTLVMTPAVNSTLALTKVAPVASTAPISPVVPVQAAPRNGRSADATVVVAYAAPVAPIAKRQPRKRMYLIGSIATVLVLILALGICASALQPTLVLSPSTVLVGGSFVVSATHVPANKVGEIRLQSQLHLFAFRADGSGNVNREIPLPPDIELGGHLVSICWDGSCHKTATLQVVSGVAEASPGPSPTSGTASSPAPRATPRTTPGATPTARPTSTPHPRSTPTPTHQPTPTPTPSPCPTPTAGAALIVSPAAIVAGVTKVSVTGQNFTPNKLVTVSYYFPSTSTTPKKTWSVSVGCDGSFSISFVPGILDIGTAAVKANDGGGRQASTTFSIA